MTFSLQREVMPIETHPFEPFLPQGARILFLGSFPPQEKRWCMPFFYPNWINDFWRIMGLVHFGDKDHFCIRGEKRFDEAAIRAFCTKEGLAFYDTACAVRRLRDNASDAFLEVVTPTDIPALLRQIPDCNNLVTTGQKASEQVAAQFGCATPPVGGCIDIRPGSGAAQADAPGADDAWTALPDASGANPPDIPGSHHAGAAFRPLRFWRMPSTSRAYPLPLIQKAALYRQLF